jgi:two-component system chemotaxis response regulator CheY
MRVLVLAEDAIARLILRRALEELGHECAFSTSGASAWELCEAGGIDVIVSDSRLHDVDLAELCRRVRGRVGGSHTYILVLAAGQDEHDVLAAVQAGADDFLAKPVDIVELETKLVAAARLDAVHRRLSSLGAEVDRLSRASHEAARVDAQTLAGNRLRLREDLATLRARVSRYGHTYAAALCGVDHFRSYNALYGFAGGDEALRRIAGALRDTLRGGDSVYRYGDDEFLVILPEQTLAGAAIAMERARRAVEDLAIEHAGITPRGFVTVSAGIAPLGGSDATSMDDWLRRADEALRNAKAAGRNRVALLG